MADITIEDNEGKPAFTVHGEGVDQLRMIDTLTAAPLMLMTLIDLIEQDAIKPENKDLKHQIIEAIEMCGYTSEQFKLPDDIPMV
jgi:hypothetical protein